ncbi:cytochrome [Arthrobacter zhaoguopingii]|uniref:cytochrome n=1 Tax=Arthrobacter zhaoguopingii TaxID=2681491 RepID=UPI001356F728|nr:cytochrome [Arthrobacter zhaoguopingii]
MTEPLLAHSTPYGRMYARSTSDQPTVPSITTVIAQAPSSLGGWFGHMAANALAADPRLPGSLGKPAELKQAVRDAAQAAERYRDDAALRGTRVHNYCEQVALRALGRPSTLDAARLALVENGEEGFAARFDEWWELYDVRPIAPELTVWNQELGYAGTLDLVATIGGRLCLIDYKTKSTDRDGFVKGLDDKVVMQLVAGMKAQESLVDSHQGEWEPWKYGEQPLLLGVAVGQTEVRALRANPEVLKEHWFRFCALRRAWEAGRNAETAGRALLPIGPPPARAAAGAPAAAPAGPAPATGADAPGPAAPAPEAPSSVAAG